MDADLGLDTGIELASELGPSAGEINGGPGTMQLNRSSTLTSKIQTILASSYSDVGLRESLETLDARGLDNDQHTRRNLRLHVQREIIDCNSEIVQDFGQVALQLKSVGNALEKLQKTCADMGKHIDAARIEAGPMIDEAESLLAQKQQVENKKAWLEATRTHFMLNDDEVAHLTSSAQPVTDAFFQALVKTKRIRKDCEVLLGAENQRLGLDILEQSSKHLNAAYPKLFRWVQREIKGLDLENPHFSIPIRRALRVLAERPTLFQNCLDAFAEARDNSLSDAFQAALTGARRDGANADGGSRGVQPLEMSAHEPLRYIGDMLAWVHSATVSEREALEVLFVSEGDEIAKSIRAGLEDEPWSRGDEEVEIFDGKKALNQLVNRDLTGIGRQLRQRIEQVIHSHDEAVLAYKIANLIGFYTNIFRRFLDADASFLETLAWLEGSATNQFRKTMEYHIKGIQSEHPMAPEDLSVPDFVDEGLDELKLLLKSYDTSVVSITSSPRASLSLSNASTTIAAEDASLRLLLAEALQPYLEICTALAEPLNEPDDHIFLANVLLAVKVPLSPYGFAVPQMAVLDKQLASHADALTGFSHIDLVDASGLGSLLEALGPFMKSDDAAHDEATLGQIVTLPALTPAALAAASAQLDAFLPSALMDATAALKPLQSTNLISQITAGAAARFCTDFERVEGILVEIDQAGLGVVKSAGGLAGLGIDRAVAGSVLSGDAEDGEKVRLLDLFPRTSEDITLLLS